MPTSAVVTAAKERLAAYDMLKRRWEDTQKVGVGTLNAKLKAAGASELKVNPPPKPVRAAPSEGDDDGPASAA